MPLKSAQSRIFLVLEIVDTASRFFDLKLNIATKVVREGLQHTCYISPHDSAVGCRFSVHDLACFKITLVHLYEKTVFHSNPVTAAIPKTPSSANIELAPFLD